MLVSCLQIILISSQKFDGKLDRLVLESWNYSIHSVSIDLSNRGIVYIDPNTFKVI
jgi:hypothetical protein